MVRRCFLVLTVVALLAGPRPVHSAETTTPTLVVSVRSIDDLLADVKYLAGLAGRERETKQVDAVVQKVLPKGFQGIDTRRPLGLYGTIDENLPDTAGVVLIPVSDEKAFVELVEQVSHSKPKKEDDGSYVLAPDNSPVSVYFRFAHKYAYV